MISCLFIPSRMIKINNSRRQTERQGRAHLKKQLDPHVVVIWFQRSLMAHLIMTVILIGLFFCGFYFQWPFPLKLGLIICAVLLLLSLTIFTFVVPRIRYHTFFYYVRKEDILIQEGVFIIRQIVLPFSRVQHVETKQGPLLRRHQLTAVLVTTAADTHEIPALREEEAIALRDQISVYIREDASYEI